MFPAKAVSTPGKRVHCAQPRDSNHGWGTRWPFAGGRGAASIRMVCLSRKGYLSPFSRLSPLHSVHVGPLGRLVAQSSPSPRPLSSQLWRGPSRVPSAARAQASSSTSSPLLPPFPAPTATNRRHGRRGLLLLRPPRHTLHPSRVRLPQSPPLDCSIPVGCRSGGEDDRRSGQSLPLGHELPRATERNLWLFTSLAAAPWRRSFLFWPRPGRGERVGGGLAPLRWRVVGGCGGCALSSFLPYDPSLLLRCGTRGVETALDSVCRLPGRGSWFVTR